MAFDMPEEQKPKNTDFLGDAPQVEASPMPRRVTGPLDQVLPWVLEFRVVGTASTIQVRVSEMMTIGRADPDRDITPDINLSPYSAHMMGVSRKHAIISTKDNGITIKDLDSANGTRLNGYSLKPNMPYRLRHGDEITFGRMTVQVLFAVVPLVTSDKPKSTNIPAIGSGQHVLIVEDDKDVGTVFGMILEQAGFRVTIDSSGVAAMNRMAHEMPDAVILDLMLPDMDGVDVASYVCKNRGVEKHIPLVVVSGATAGFQMNKAKEAGADIFLGKPVGVDELVEAMIQIMPQMA
jgi:CheY-like chemotaxis protein